MRTARRALLAVLVGLAACQTQAVAPEAPARLLSNAACQAQLEAVIGDQLGGKVTLSANALTGDFPLIVERARVRDPAGHPQPGRLLGLPERFDLVRVAEQCVLVRLQDASRTALDACRCLIR
jgi:hypothetical protein